MTWDGKLPIVRALFAKWRTRVWEVLSLCFHFPSENEAQRKKELHWYRAATNRISHGGILLFPVPRVRKKEESAKGIKNAFRTLFHIVIDGSVVPRLREDLDLKSYFEGLRRRELNFPDFGNNIAEIYVSRRKFILVSNFPRSIRTSQEVWAHNLSRCANH